MENFVCVTMKIYLLPSLAVAGLSISIAPPPSLDMLARTGPPYFPLENHVTHPKRKIVHLPSDDN